MADPGTDTATLAGPDAARCARPAVCALLTGLPTVTVTAACLLTSELVADADRGGARLTHLELRRDADLLHIAVLRTEPAVPAPALDAEAVTGRLVLEELAADWGTAAVTEATTVTWATLRLVAG